MTISIPVTSLFALCLTMLIIYLALQVVRFRRKHRVGFGDNENNDLRKAIAAHSNAIENIPLALMLLLLLELNKLDQILLLVIGSALLVARILHSYGLLQSTGVSFGRTYGAMFSWMIMVFMAVLNLVYALT